MVPSANTEKGVEPFWVAIAPFATHTGKIYPLDKMEQVVAALAQRTDVRVFLFGAGSQEQTVLEDWAKRYPQTESVAGKAEGLQQEAALVSHCKVMVSMDSANMHLASLVAVPVVSIWGATHPQGGFLGYGQTMQNVIQRDDLACRPCSIFGKTSCRWGDYRCLAGISPQMVVDKINEFLK
jgi:ADP-heptose:LPS heptosyltransferase